MSEEIVQDCRGIILDEQNNWEVVAMAFRKFFNYGEKLAAEIDWSTAVVQEKLDGSLMVLYPYANQWHVATSGSPDASGAAKNTRTTFAECFWQIFRASGMVLPGADCATCFFFELTGPGNQHVVAYADADPRLTVLGCRSLANLEESTPAAAAALLRHPSPGATARTFPLASLAEVTAAFRGTDPTRQEGFVVVDAAWRRVKAKHPAYVALAYAGSVDGLSRPKALVALVRAGEGGEVVASFPHLRAAVDDAARRYGALVAAVAADAERLAGLADPAAFAAEADGTRWARALKELRGGRAATPRDAVDGLKLEQLVALLGYDSE